MQAEKSVSQTIFIDTLFVIALINTRDQYHALAEKVAKRYEGSRFLITDAVLIEIANGLARGFKPQAVEVIEQFLSSDDILVVRLTPELFDEAFNLYQSYRDKEWGLTDCVTFVVMRQAGIQEALTFDQHFVQAGFKALLRDDA
jgi:predicted nucleic acid-binding protein